MADTRTHLSRRERQIMDVIYRLGRATVQDVRDQLPDPPGYSAVRALLRVLEEKGHVKHRELGTRYVYMPIVSRERARVSAMRQMIGTFFDGSAAAAAAALLDLGDGDLSDEELDRLESLIERARTEDR
jgi:predicted transcriptional regulator